MKRNTAHSATDVANWQCHQRLLSPLVPRHRAIRPLAVVHPACTSHYRAGSDTKRLGGITGPPYSVARATRSQEVSADVSYEEYEEGIGPAFKATLGLLDWPLLCSYLSEFASTAVGKRRCRELSVPELQTVTEQLQRETR